MPHKGIALKIEHFYHDEDIGFHVSSRMEMLFILQGIARQKSPVALYYGKGQSFILSMLLDVNEYGMWLDVGPSLPKNMQLLASREITFVGVHQHVKIQFTAQHIESTQFENREAFYMDLPDYLLRIQRREFFRIYIPASAQAKCIVPIPPDNQDDPPRKHEVPVFDISGGGIGLICDEDDGVLLPDRVFHDCRILLPDIGLLSASLEVRYSIDFTPPGYMDSKRVGCRFLHLDTQANILLQRLITQLQLDSMVESN